MCKRSLRYVHSGGSRAPSQRPIFLQFHAFFLKIVIKSYTGARSPKVVGYPWKNPESTTAFPDSLNSSLLLLKPQHCTVPIWDRTVWVMLRGYLTANSL